MTHIKRRVGLAMTGAAALLLVSPYHADTQAQSPAALTGLRQQIDSVRVDAMENKGFLP